ncbi:hypothetical protein [Nocardia callitridis]|uniref:hypothetical protein n=1 Tax=Nocardia callitridis TaxID=648753 RepID=UPI0031EFD59C
MRKNPPRVDIVDRLRRIRTLGRARAPCLSLEQEVGDRTRIDVIDGSRWSTGTVWDTSDRRDDSFDRG